MAKKRMFSKEVLDTDAFLDMPLSAQALYFHLNLRADDDGFIANPRRIQTYVGASVDDLKLLISKRFLIVFDDGVVVVKHWRMHNTIQKDRYTPTNYIDDLRMLGIKENKAYTLDADAKPVIEEKKTAEAVSKKNTDVESVFETAWKSYPRKEGKSQVNKKAKKRLEELGLETVLAAIENYKRRIVGKDKQYILMGSTFFNGRIEDYIPEVPAPRTVKPVVADAEEIEQISLRDWLED